MSVHFGYGNFLACFAFSCNFATTNPKTQTVMKKMLQFSIAFALLLICGKVQAQNWEVVGEHIGITYNNTNSKPSLAFSSIGEPYVAYEDIANSDKATVKRFDGTDWVTVGTAGFSESGAHDISLAFNSNDEPYVSFSRSEDLKVTVMKFDGAEWVTVGTAGFSTGG